MVNWQSPFGARTFCSLPDAGAPRFLPLQIDFLTEPLFQWLPPAAPAWGLSPPARRGSLCHPAPSASAAPVPSPRMQLCLSTRKLGSEN